MDRFRLFIYGGRNSTIVNNAGIGMEWYKHRSANLQMNEMYFHKNLMFIENIRIKIANDISLAEFKHIKINPDTRQWQIQDTSDLTYVLTKRANEYETPTNFWIRVIKHMLTKDFAVVIPEYNNGRIVSLELVRYVREVVDNWVYYYTYEDWEEHDTPNRIRVENCWVFENPREGLIHNLKHMESIIGYNLDRLIEKLSEPSKLFGFLKLPTRVEDKMMKEKAIDRINNIMEVAEYGGIGYLQLGEEFQELNRTFNTASADDIDFLKKQIYTAYGLNDAIFDGTYTEMQYRAYHQAVLLPIIHMIQQEINSKYFSRTAITQGHKLIVSFNFFNIVSLKDLNEFATQMKWNAIMTANEIRSVVGMSPYEGGDEYTSNLNAVSIGGLPKNTVSTGGANSENQSGNDQNQVTE